ncbi:MAG: 7,8-dihydro-8-oxoguanine triphosphatase, partial [Candidatus Electrothrix sp. EH2]|nr:7,8-dihydro-8-oxoguanine triphosphatase [Candidatus Electrothrix sp. EH2]
VWFFFLITRFDGIPRERNKEGELAWHGLDRLEELPMWEGDRYFLPLVFDKNPLLFHGCMPYKKGRPVSWRYFR